MAKTVRLKVITPSEAFYEGDVEMVIVETLLGEEGFMADHSWACMLLEDNARLKIKEPGEPKMLEATVSGGFIDVKRVLTIYTDEAEWGVKPKPKMPVPKVEPYSEEVFYGTQVFSAPQQEVVTDGIHEAGHFGDIPRM